MTKTPISVVIPCYNGEAYLRESLNSIDSQQWDFEIILVDDGSTDNSKQIILNEYSHVHYHYQDNSSPAAARNTGIRLASHDIVAFLDADDIWSAQKTKWQMDILSKYPETDVIGGLMDYKIMPESNYRASLYSDKPLEHILLSTLIVKKNVFNKIGFFDESLRIGEDMDWFLRLKESTLIYKSVDRVLLYYRIHEKGITAKKTFKELNWTNVIHKSLERKRNVRS